MDSPSASGENAAPPLAVLLAKFRRAAAIGGVLKIFSIGLSFAFFLALSAATSPEIFGVISAAYSVSLVLGYVGAIGQHVAVLRFWPALDEKYGAGVASRVVARGLMLTIVGGTMTGLGLIIVGRLPQVINTFGGDEMVVFCTAALILATALAEFTASALRARGILVLALAPRDIVARLIVIFLLLVVLPHPVTAAPALMLVALSMSAAAAPQVAYLAAELVRYRGNVMPTTERRQLNRATLGLWVSSSIEPIMANVTTLVVAITLGPVAAGAYFAAERLAKLLSIALEGTEKITGPLLARSYHAGRLEEVQAVVAATSALAFGGAVVGAVAYLLLGRLALELFDPSYAAVLPVLLILVVGQLVNTACGSNSILLNMAGRELDLLAIRAVWGIMGIIGTYLMASNFGLIGAATASACVMIGWNLTAVVVCRLRLGVTTVFFGAPATVLRSTLASFKLGRKRSSGPRD